MKFMNEQYMIFKKKKKSLKLKNRNFDEFYRNCLKQKLASGKAASRRLAPELGSQAMLGKCSQMALYDTRGGTERLGSGSALNKPDRMQSDFSQRVKCVS